MTAWEQRARAKQNGRDARKGGPRADDLSPRSQLGHRVAPLALKGDGGAHPRAQAPGLGRDPERGPRGNPPAQLGSHFGRKLIGEGPREGGHGALGGLGHRWASKAA
eukprot:2609182-Pyramimonas_sp.AAC.1